MSRRIEIELTSARSDGTWNWRAAGAREPKGVLEGSLLPDGSKTGDVLKVDADFSVDGINVQSVVTETRARKEPTLLELIPSDRPFEAVVQTRAPGGDRRGSSPRRERSDRDRRPRDGEGGDRRRGPRTEGDRAGRPPRGDRSGGDRPGGDRSGGDRSGGARSGGDRPDRPERPRRPRFEPVPELPQRPRPKRLKPGRAHRTAVLAGLSEAERPIAEKALQGGIPAVRQAVQEQNASLKAEGKEQIPAAGLLKMAEELLPKLRVAEWLDRADAAKADLAELDLRDLRSVVAAADDPAVARDEATRALASELKTGLATKQEAAYTEWVDDIGLALEVGRVIRALKLSSEPPKAGVRFPAELAQRLTEATNANLTAEASGERWSAVLEAAAFSPVRTQVTPTAPAATVTDELRATVTRLAPLLPQVAALYSIEVVPGATAPKPLRPTRKPEPKRAAKPAPDQAAGGPGRGGKGRHSERPPKEATPAATRGDAPSASEAPATVAETPSVDEPTASATDAPKAEETATVDEAPAETTTDAPAVDETPAETTTDAPAVEETPAETTTDAPAVEETPAETTTDAPAVEETPAETTTDAPAVEETPAEPTTVAPAVEETPAAEATAPAAHDETPEAAATGEAPAPDEPTDVGPSTDEGAPHDEAPTT